MSKSNITLGSDPEVFLFNKETNEYFPALGIIGGTKDKPVKITESGHSLQEDNVMVELGIPPCKTKEELYEHLQFLLRHISHTIPNTLEVKIEASAIFNPKHLTSNKAQTFGCDPDFNAWTMKINKVGQSNPLMRTCGGHIHIGYPNRNILKSVEIIKAMDLFLGVPSILMDKDTKRREVYGKAGAFRPQDWGCEYRVLSNFWLKSKELTYWAFENTLLAYEYSDKMKEVSTEDSQRIIECINNCDKDLARELIYEFNIPIIKEECITVKTLKQEI